jgi:phenylalanyl-tRNA synthetase beta subunit
MSTDPKRQPGATVAGWAPDEKSLAVRLTLGSDEATLTDEQIEACSAGRRGAHRRQTLGARQRA